MRAQIVYPIGFFTVGLGSAFLAWRRDRRDEVFRFWTEYYAQGASQQAHWLHQSLEEFALYKPEQADVLRRARAIVGMEGLATIAGLGFGGIFGFRRMLGTKHLGMPPLLTSLYSGLICGMIVRYAAGEIQIAQLGRERARDAQREFVRYLQHTMEARKQSLAQQRGETQQTQTPPTQSS